MKVVVPAEPESIEIDIQRTAIIVVDMQHAFCSKEGMFDILGKLDEVKASRVIEIDKKVIEAARDIGIKIIYLRMAFRPDLSDTGGPESPHYWKTHMVRRMHEDSEVRGKFITQGSWDAEIVDELKPEPEDIVVDKNRYSGFPNTELDAVLRTHNIKYLVFLGIATNACVESTLRDAFFREYFPILISDGCGNSGPDFTQNATIWIVSTLFGWVTTSSDLIQALK
ncbi:isochorismatase family protein [Chloroflexota bacterium]